MHVFMLLCLHACITYRYVCGLYACGCTEKLFSFTYEINNEVSAYQSVWWSCMLGERMSRCSMAFVNSLMQRCNPCSPEEQPGLLGKMVDWKLSVCSPVQKCQCKTREREGGRYFISNKEKGNALQIHKGRDATLAIIIREKKTSQVQLTLPLPCI